MNGENIFLILRNNEKMNPVKSMFAIRDSNGMYYCGAGNYGKGIWDKQLRKARIYTSYNKVKEMLELSCFEKRFEGRNAHIVSVDVIDKGIYNPHFEQ